MLKLLKNAAQVVTVNSDGEGFKRGSSLSQISPLIEHSIIIENDRIKDLVPNRSIKNLSTYQVIDIKGRIILPGFVECHTHTAFAGSRAEEFRRKLSGVSYEEIAKSGGGINSTVEAVRKTSFDDLVELTKPKVDYFISQGITTLEIKSGYGLNFENEIKLLNVINHLNVNSPIDLIPCFLGAHTYPKEYRNDHEAYIKLIIDEMLPFIAANKLAKYCDGFCEPTAFSAEEIKIIFSKAADLGMKLRLHTEQFNNIGGLQRALNLNALSVDHLEVVNDEDVKKISASETAAVLLPGVSFFLNHKFAPARKLIDSGAIVALSTDYNPGSSHIAGLNLIMSIAALKMNMTIEEAISAVTINAARAMNLSDEIGSIEINKKADFSIFDAEDYSEIVYNIGKNLNFMTIKNGQIIYSKQI